MSVRVRSRYWSLKPLEAPAPGDAAEKVATLPIRPQPRQPTGRPVNHLITGVEDLEYLAWRYYGHSDAWWHIADANGLSFPLDYRPGASVTVPQGTSVGRVLRTRG